jgi:FixJ family two-component response regulator
MVKKLVLHYVDGDLKGRARFAQLCVQLGHHCEIYDDLSELSAHPPRDGLVVIRDAPEFGGIGDAIARLESQGIWLPVLAVGDASTPAKIVDAIKSGALDYMVMPIELERLERSLKRNAEDAEHVATSRRRKLEAQQLLETLSNRENEVLDLLALGLSNKHIAYELGISPRTVEIHRSNMMSKLGATHPAGVIRIKMESQLV